MVTIIVIIKLLYCCAISILSKLNLFRSNYRVRYVCLTDQTAHIRLHLHWHDFSGRELRPSGTVASFHVAHVAIVGLLLPVRGNECGEGRGFLDYYT